MHPMLPSPATERRTSRNVGPGPQLRSCEAQRDLIFARVRVNSKPRLNQRNRADAAHRTGILKPLTHRARALAPPDARNTANRSANQHIERLDLLGGLIHEYRAAA